jgi:hypothetical protein
MMDDVQRIAVRGELSPPWRAKSTRTRMGHPDLCVGKSSSPREPASGNGGQMWGTAVFHETDNYYPCASTGVWL